MDTPIKDRFCRAKGGGTRVERNCDMGVFPFIKKEDIARNIDAELINVWKTIVCWLCFYTSVTSD